MTFYQLDDGQHHVHFGLGATPRVAPAPAS